MKRPAGQHRVLHLGGREHFDLPADRAPLPSMGNTEWDRWARHEQRKRRVGLRLAVAEAKAAEEPVDERPRCGTCGCTMQSKTCGQLHYTDCPEVKTWRG